MTNTFDRLPQILWEAARGKLPDDVLDQMADDKDAPRAAPDIAALQAENARLRDALVVVASITKSLARDIPEANISAFKFSDGRVMSVFQALEIARAALGAEKPTEGKTT